MPESLTHAPLVIGRYAIYGEIASGGMATVHFARLLGPAGFARTVAVKRLHPNVAKDRELALLFMDEARLAARIRHPNVVSTLDVIEYGSELVLVMDYVHGESLSKIFRAAREAGEPMPARFAASIMIDVLHGLHAAHDAKGEQGQPLGIVHRDVSPQNILVGVDGISRVVDFGVAKAVGRAVNTSGGAIKGKLSYMAPEQIRAEPVSRVSDVYAATIVLWEILTGNRLFLGENEGATIHNCLTLDVPPPSTLVPGLSPAFDVIVAKGLSRIAGARYQTARDMALALEASVDPVRPSEIGAWLERAAGDELAERAQIVAEIESSASGSLLSSVAPSMSSFTPTPPPTSAPPVEGTVSRNFVPPAWTSATSDGPPSRPGVRMPKSAHSKEVTVLEGSGRRTAPPPSVKRRPWALFVAPVVIVAALAAAFVVNSASHSQGVGPEGAGALGASASAVVADPSAAPSSVGTSLTNTAVPGTTTRVVAGESAPDASVVERERDREHTGAPHVPGAVRGPRVSPRARPILACDPPYSIDEKGRKIFKPECL